MIARVWFRKSGASDGLWWTAEIDGEEWACANIEFRTPARTEWERDADRARAEQRHYIEATIAGFRWDGPNLVLE